MLFFLTKTRQPDRQRQERYSQRCDERQAEPGALSDFDGQTDGLTPQPSVQVERQRPGPYSVQGNVNLIELGSRPGVQSQRRGP